MNLAARDVRHNLGRFLLTCLGLSLLMAIVMSMIGIYRGLVDEALGLARAPRADLWVVEAGTNGPFAEASRIPADARDLVARLHGVAGAGALTFQAVETEHGGRKLRLYAVGFEPGRPGEPERLVAGRPIGRDHFELVADLKTGLTLGEVVRLGRRDYVVVGLTQGQMASGGDPVVYLRLPDSQRLQFELEPGAARREAARGASPANLAVVNAVVARMLPGFRPEEAAEAARRWKHLGALTQAEQENLLTSSVVDKARKQIGMFTVLLVTVSAVIIALIIYTLTMDKLREIATLKLIGAPDRTIVGLIVQEAVLMAVLGFGLGAVLVALFHEHFPRRVLLEPLDGLALFGVILVVCLAASATGVRLALKVEPAAALGG